MHQKFTLVRKYQISTLSEGCTFCKLTLPRHHHTLAQKAITALLLTTELKNLNVLIGQDNTCLLIFDVSQACETL